MQHLAGVIINIIFTTAENDSSQITGVNSIQLSEFTQQD